MKVKKFKRVAARMAGRSLAFLVCFLCVLVYVARPETVADIPKHPRMFRFRTDILYKSRMWFYNAIIPSNVIDSRFIAMSISPGNLRATFDAPKAGQIIKRRDLTFWKGGTSRMGQLDTGNYDYADDVPNVITQKEDVYIFFLKANDIKPNSRVARCTAGGWAWQSLDSVEESVRQEVRIADFIRGRVIDATGKQVSDISDIKASLPDSDSAIDLGCRASDSEVIGLAGVPARSLANVGGIDNLPQRPPLPYKSVYFYDKRKASSSMVKLEAVRLQSSRSNARARSEKSLQDIASAVGRGDELYFGQPVIERIEPLRVFYWYCIKSQINTGEIKYILAFFDGQASYAVDAYIIDSASTMQYWQGNSWIKVQQQLYWDYEPHLGYMVQPIVGLDSEGNVLAYRPPDFMRVREMRND